MKSSKTKQTTVQFSYGNRKAKGSSTAFLEDEVGNMFAHHVLRNSGSSFPIKIRKLESDLRQRLTTMYDRGIFLQLSSWFNQHSVPRKMKNYHEVSFIPDTKAETMSGWDRQSAKFSPQLRALETTQKKIRWLSLSETTYARKSERHFAEGADKPALVRKAATKFFVDYGNLKGELLRRNRQMIMNTGVVKVRSTELNANSRWSKGKWLFAKKGARTKTRFEVATLTLKLLPAINRASLPGLRTGDYTQDTGKMGFEHALGFSEDVLAKLGNLGEEGDGTHRVKRPMLQPIFTYYTLFRAPKLIALEIEKAKAEAAAFNERTF